MKLNKKNIKEYQDIYKAHYGVSISRKKAEKHGMSLINLMKFSISPKQFDYGE